MHDELERLRQENERLKAMVFRDEMTGLYNRRYFEELLDSEVQRCRRYRRILSLMFIDVDLFKNINDQYGHPAGDEVIKQIGMTLKHESRRCDEVFRYGGDEYAIILPETALVGALAIAERIRLNVNGQHIEFEGNEIPVTVSIGVAGCSPSSGDIDRDNLVARCDEALYKAKDNGRNRAMAWINS